LGPYEIQKVHDNGTLTLITIDGSGYAFKANGHQVHLYRKPLTPESFYQQLHQDLDMQILGKGEKSSSSMVHQVIYFFLQLVHNFCYCFESFCTFCFVVTFQTNSNIIILVVPFFNEQHFLFCYSFIKRIAPIGSPIILL